MASTAIKFAARTLKANITTTGAVLCCRLAMVFIRGGALRWPFKSADEFNKVAVIMGRPERVSEWETVKMMAEFEDMRDVIGYIAGMPILPWEKETP